jgi:two-component system chemotaxis sensor kinase CheA
MDDLLSEFVAETRETLEALAGEVVAWEAAPDDRARLDAIFRFVHTVKGSCGFLDLPRLERLSHAAEDVLAEVRADKRKPDAMLVSAVLAIIDRIGELTDAIDAGESLPDGDDQLLIAALAPGGTAISEAPRSAIQAVGPVRAVTRSIRLPIDLLDRMMASVSDMVLARNELARRLRDTDIDPGTEVAFERVSTCIAEMRDAITRTRMARIDHLFAALPRMVRDLSAELGKLVTLDIEGGDVELDREMIEMIRDPLTHIVRNAIDHGIETPGERQRAGKPTAGKLRVRARQAGNQILIEVVDDGRGIDGDKLVQRAIASGLITLVQAEGLSWSRKLDLIFEPGLSTAKAVTSVSGRGVGMDVVRANVERIGGVVDIDSVAGSGLSLTMRVPLTLTIIPALTVSTGGQHFAIPRSVIEEIVRVGGETVRIEHMGGAPIASIRGLRMPVVELGSFIGMPAEVTARPILVVLKPAGGECYALAVEAVHDHEELVVKPAAPLVMATGIYAGTTLPDNSRPMLLLDVTGIASAAGVLFGSAPLDAQEELLSGADDDVVPTLLFRDLDGVERAIRLAVVERIEDVAASAASFVAGRMRLTHDDRIIPLMSCGVPVEQARMRILRMSDGDTQIAYAIDSVIDIIAHGTAMELAAAPGLVGGVALIEGRPVEFIDPHWLFAEAIGEGRPTGSGPICLLADAEDPWTRQVLRPLIEAAGYRVVLPGETAAEQAEVVIGSEHSPMHPDRNVPMIRLRAGPDGAGSREGSVYRYDRSGLIEALRGRTAAGRGR